MEKIYRNKIKSIIENIEKKNKIDMLGWSNVYLINII